MTWTLRSTLAALWAWLRARPLFAAGRRLRYAWPLRVPIISGTLLVAWPWIAYSDALKPFLSGLFDPVAPAALMLITTVALLNAWAVLIIWCLVASYGAERLDLPARAPVIPSRWWHWGLAALMAVPVVYRTARLVSLRTDVPAGTAWAFAIYGVTAAVALLAVAFGISLFFARSGVRRVARESMVTAPYRALIGFLNRFPALRHGFIDPGPPPRLRPGHGQAFGLAVASLVAYVWTGLETADITRPLYASTLAYLLMLQLVLTWIAGLGAFLLDRSRAPLVVFIALFILIVNVAIHPFWSTDHVYRTYKEPQPLMPRVSPAELLGSEPVSIVVAASGGGIQSAAWTARVMSALDAQLPQFRRHVRLISAVSGGSVGAMNMLASWPDCGPPRTAKEAEVKFDPNGASRESSLHAVGWGLVFKDLPRIFFPYFASPEIDRGSVLEDAWKREARLQRTTDAPLLASWRRNVRERQCPGLIYNAMVAETGEPMLFSTIALPDTIKAFDFYAHYPGRDLPITTAARLSAGFPYVSPASRADEDRNHYSHIVDGGYFDNYGILTVASVVHEALEKAHLPPALRRILVIEICDTAECSGKQASGQINAGGEQNRSWAYQITAPLSAVMNMRTSAQRVNNREALRLLKAYWRPRGVCIESIDASFDGAGAPMSWHMTAKEQLEVENAWWYGDAAAVTNEVTSFLYQRDAPVGQSQICPQ